MYDYSYLVLYDEYFSLLKQLFETKSRADSDYQAYVRANQTTLYNQILGNISEKIFYMQTLNNKLENMTLTMLEVMTADMEQTTVDFDSLKSRVFFLSFGWFLVAFAVGVGLICVMKRQYFREAYMVTFLSSEMMLNNKRVESFLDSLSKSTES